MTEKWGGIVTENRGFLLTEKWGEIVTENSGNSSFRNKKKDIFVAILKSYARNISTEARRKIMIDDVSENRGKNIEKR